MASVKNKDIREECDFQAECFMLRKKFYIGEPEDEFWDELFVEVNALSDKYKSEYLDELLLLCVYDIEQRYNRSVGEGAILKPGRQLDNLYSRLKKKYTYTKGEGGM